jgi:hypothetical protein
MSYVNEKIPAFVLFDEQLSSFGIPTHQLTLIRIFFDRHFFLCDFPGHVLTWTSIPDGASFRAGPVRNFFGELGPTDIAFHPDGGALRRTTYTGHPRGCDRRLSRPTTLRALRRRPPATPRDV